ncbi:hypothetical protein CQY22_017300 [Mycolicibacterium brumae]|uniref:Uncharacterized protein n=1 Tax=Mycolicibacterium brumae TaxID=85968 RepID=A0A2G5P4J6_9MYCO|nr:hypothetical protein CQY22_017300 [Mycolicibacterium brumae]
MADGVRLAPAPSDLCALEPFWPSRRLMAFDERCCPRS